MDTVTTSKAVETVKKSANKAVSAAKENPMTLVYLGAGALGIYLVAKLVKAANDAADAVSDDPNAGGGNVDPSNASDMQQGATITNAQAQTMASRLLAAMSTLGGVDDGELDSIKSVFRGRNIKDFALISIAFGKPRRSIFTGEGSVWWLGGEKLNLSEWLALELDEQQKNELSAVIPGVF